MSGIKVYFKEETKSCMLGLEHPKPSDFYLSAWQGTRSSVPLLIFRILLFASSVSIVLWSMILYIINGIYGYWFIYLTHWGLTSIVLVTGFSVVVSARVYFYGPLNETDLPWYVSMYWFLYNVGITIALVITALYWLLLYDPMLAEEMGPRLFWLDIMSHGFNSLVAVAELVASRTPLHLAHVFQPLGVGLWYAAFTAVYYVAGGTDANGFPFIYEVLDWRHGKRSTTMVVISAAALLIIYLVLYGVTACRDKISTATVRTTSVELPRVPADLQDRFPDVNGFV